MKGMRYAAPVLLILGGVVITTTFFEEIMVNMPSLGMIVTMSMVFFGFYVIRKGMRMK